MHTSYESPMAFIRKAYGKGAYWVLDQAAPGGGILAYEFELRSRAMTYAAIIRNPKFEI